MNTLKSLFAGASLLCAGAFAACENAGADNTTVTPGDDGTVTDGGIGEQTLALRFETMGDTQTSCGTATGIHVVIADPSGAAQSCDSTWSDAKITGDFAGGASGSHLVADCLFVVRPGVWSVRSIDAVDSTGAALGCCSSNFPGTVTINESATTEFGAQINCQTVQSGGLDIYAYMNRPPQINNVTIKPSKFGKTCGVITLAGAATDPEGDAISFQWSVVSAPTGATYALAPKGQQAFFVGSTLGTYQLDLKVSDASMSQHLTFPLHLVEQGSAPCNPQSLTNGAANPTP